MNGIVGFFDVFLKFVTAGVIAGGASLANFTYSPVPPVYTEPVPAPTCTVCALSYDSGCTALGSGLIAAATTQNSGECEKYCASQGASYCQYSQAFNMGFNQCYAYRTSFMIVGRVCNAGMWDGACYTTTACANTSAAQSVPVVAAADGGAGGTNASGSGATQSAKASVTCTPKYSCSGQTIVYRDATCADTDVRTCIAPSLCEDGSSVCKIPPVAFGTFDGTYDYTDAQGAHTHTTLPLTGHLRAYPSLVKPGQPARLYWKVINAKLCTVSSPTFPDLSSSALFSGTEGLETPPIHGASEFTLHCLALPGAAPATLDEHASVNILPNWQEQ